MKLSQTKKGGQYQVMSVDLLQSIAHRLAILGLNKGVFIEVLNLYRHGAVIKTRSGHIALDAEVIDAIEVSAI